MLPVRVLISLARSVLDGSAMEKAEVAEFGEGGGYWLAWWQRLVRWQRWTKRIDVTVILGCQGP
jgi:hypothetical protein